MIGVFDSGVGGLTVVREIKKLLPDVSVVYFGDTARLPYGNKSPETIQKYSLEIVRFLKEQGCETIVIACNTASALAADHVRKNFPELDVYDVVSMGAKAVAESTKSKKIGVIGTTATISSGVYKEKIAEIDPQIEVFSQACPLFVHLVEENWISRPETKKIVRTYLRNLKPEKVDTLLLGCTHYPLLEKIISGSIGKRTRIVSSGKKLAGELEKKKTGYKKGEDRYLVSDMTSHFQTLARKILGKKIKIEKKEL